MSLKKVLNIGDLNSLIASLENLTGPDRAHDLCIFDHLFDTESGLPHFASGQAGRSLSRLKEYATTVTSSLDAALDLLERALPGRAYSVGNSGGDTEITFVACVGNKPTHGPLGRKMYIGRSNVNPAVALCIATLKKVLADATGEIDPADKISEEIRQSRKQEAPQ